VNTPAWGKLAVVHLVGTNSPRHRKTFNRKRGTVRRWKSAIPCSSTRTSSFSDSCP